MYQSTSSCLHAAQKRKPSNGIPPRAVTNTVPPFFLPALSLSLSLSLYVLMILFYAVVRSSL